MQVPLTAIIIPKDRVAVEEWSPDDGSWGQVQKRGSSRALMRGVGPTLVWYHLGAGAALEETTTALP